MKPKNLLIAALLFAMMFMVSTFGSSNAQPREEETPPPERKTDVLRGIYNYEIDPGALWLPAESETDSKIGQSTTPSFSPEWSRIVYQSYRDGSWNSYLLDPNGIEWKYGNSYFPSLKKNGSVLAYSSVRNGTYDLYRINANYLDREYLTDSPEYEIHPAWSPRGDKIAFQSDLYGNFDIFVMDSNGGGKTALTTSQAYDGEPSWSPNGEQIVFVSNRAGNYDLWAMNADGSNLHQLTHGYTTMTPAWSPKGDMIAFAHDENEGGFFDVWTLDLITSRTERYGIRAYGTRDAWAPFWSPDQEWLGYIYTVWFPYQGQWYWSRSELRIDSFPKEGNQSTFPDLRIWSADWVANDVLPPGDCAVSSSTQDAWAEIPVRFSAQDTGGAGIMGYEGQYRLENGIWQDMVNTGLSDGGIYSGNGLGQAAFRCRAYDKAYNYGQWSDTPALSSEIDAFKPISKVTLDNRTVRGTRVEVQWNGYDIGTGVDTYSVFYRDGEDGEWAKWVDNSQEKSKEFTGQIGHTYYFRSQAKDQVGHTEPWSPANPATISLFTNILTTTVTDLRGYPIRDAKIDLQPSAVYTDTAETGTHQLFLSQAITHTLGITRSGYANPSEFIIPAAVDTDFHGTLPPVENKIRNGDFETGALDGWSVNPISSTVMAQPGHAGEYALRLQTSSSETTAVSQTILVDAGYHLPTLSFFYQTSAGSTDGNFHLDISTPFTKTTVALSPTADEWDHFWIDLSEYQGETITLTWRLASDNHSALLDEVAVGPWETPFIKSINPSRLYISQPLTVQISGKNFLPAAAVFFGDIQITDVTWISSTLLTVNLPPNFSPGIYSVTLQQHDISSILPHSFEYQAHRVFLPVVLDTVQTTKSETGDWRMLGYDLARTKYNHQEVGASRYTLAWKYNVTEPCTSYRSSVAVADGILIVGTGACNTTEAGTLVALNAEDGTQIWKKSGAARDPNIANGLVYLFFKPTPYSKNESLLRAYNLYDGSEIFTAKSNQSILAVGDRVYSQHGYSRSINASTGSIIWEKDFGSPGSLIAINDGNLIVWGGSSIFQVIDSATGDKIWDLTVNDYGDSYVPAPIVSENTAIISKRYPTQQIIAIDLRKQKIKWKADPNSTSYWSFPTVAVGDGMVYSVIGGMTVMEVRDLNTGKLISTFEGDSPIYTPVLTKNYIYLASSENIFVLDRTTYEVVDHISPGGRVAIANGFLYIYSDDNVLRAYRATTP